MISTHTLTWSVTNKNGNPWFKKEFQLTRSRGAWHSGFATGTNYQDFNSHAHVERDVQALILTAFTEISTHTLTWSVTMLKWEITLLAIISTHTLTWSVTLLCLYYTMQYPYFNSHAHVERDLLRPYHLFCLEHFNSHAHVERDWGNIRHKEIEVISTHTLTWSVTVMMCVLLWTAEFQLTRSRGAWQNCRTKIVTDWHFNSHAHVERDRFIVYFFLRFFISTHTLTWSVTKGKCCSH